jgi:hypothetical protein
MCPLYLLIRQKALREPTNRPFISILKAMRVNLERCHRVRMPEPVLNLGDGLARGDESARISKPFNMSQYDNIEFARIGWSAASLSAKETIYW